MPHGGPDWGPGAPGVTVYGLQDLGELAARLGSIVTFDRRGNVVWLDDFQHGISAWVFTGSGSGHAAAWVTNTSRSRGFSMKLTTGDAASDNKTAYHYQPMPVSSKLGFEFSVSHDANLLWLLFGLNLFDGSYWHAAMIKWIAADDKFQYLDSDGNYQDISPTKVLYSAAYLFNTLKLVADLEAEEYVRLMANNTEFDLSGIKYQKTPSSYEGYLYVHIGVYTNTNDHSHAYVDDPIITQNEP